jgi:hypothetical protein
MRRGSGVIYDWKRCCRHLSDLTGEDIFRRVAASQKMKETVIVKGNRFVSRTCLSGSQLLH